MAHIDRPHVTAQERGAYLLPSPNTELLVVP